jgi:DNA-directed RNA polymerase specialized sigma24 family protein
MVRMNRTPNDSFAAAVEAVGNLWTTNFSAFRHSADEAGMMAHGEIERSQIAHKSGCFYRNLAPHFRSVVQLVTDSYRQYFKIALAHPIETGPNPDEWAWYQLRLVFHTSLGWLEDWYILACDGANRYVQPMGTIEYQPGQSVSLPIPTTVPPYPPLKSWRAPAWLFQISPMLGIYLLKSEHVPLRDSEERLGAGHTRLLLKGARRMFLDNLGAAIETVRNEELAAAGAIQTHATGGEQTGVPKKPKHWLKGTKGLTLRADLSQYKQGLTKKQELAFSLKYEYGVGPAELAARMGISRKTAHEHLEAADKKIKYVHSAEKRMTNRAKGTPE